MKEAVIKKVESVKDGVVYVSLYGMRSDLSQSIEIRLSDIQGWYGVDDKGFSISYSITEGAIIYYDDIILRRIVNPRFFNRMKSLFLNRMKSLFLNRMKSLLLGVLVFVCFILIVSEPSNDDNFYIVMLIKTVLGFALWGIARILYKRWCRM